MRLFACPSASGGDRPPQLHKLNVTLKVILKLIYIVKKFSYRYKVFKPSKKYKGKIKETRKQQVFSLLLVSWKLAQRKNPFRQRKKVWHYCIKPILVIWRRRGDSNPSWTVSPLSVFKTDPFNHLGTPPERWWSIGGLNAEPGDYKSPALTSWANGPWTQVALYAFFFPLLRIFLHFLGAHEGSKAYPTP